MVIVTESRLGEDSDIVKSFMKQERALTVMVNISVEDYKQ